MNTDENRGHMGKPSRESAVETLVAEPTNMDEVRPDVPEHQDPTTEESRVEPSHRSNLVHPYKFIAVAYGGVQKALE